MEIYFLILKLRTVWIKLTSRVWDILQNYTKGGTRQTDAFIYTSFETWKGRVIIQEGVTYGFPQDSTSRKLLGQNKLKDLVLILDKESS